VTSVGDLATCVSDRVRNENAILWFRGQRTSSWHLATRLWRDYDGAAERDLTNRFCARAAIRHETKPSYDDDAAWLSIMQHYGLPTRLLDWTRSPLIAAYFAVQHYIYDNDPRPEDAAIWVLEPHELNEVQGIGRVTPSIEAHTCRDSLRPAFTDKASETNKILAVMAAERDIRMFVQQGCFTIHSDRTDLDVRPDANQYLERWDIPADRVKRMAHEIDACGFRRGDIFPDLANLADELRILRPRHY
jgi:hypothetical protein